MVSLMLSRRVLLTDRMLRQGAWVSVAVDPDVRMGTTLAGRTVGVVGMGEIGQEVVRGLAPLGVHAQAVRRNLVAPEGLPRDSVAELSGLDDLMSTSDIVVLAVLWWGHPKDGPGVEGYTRPFEVLDNVVMTPHNSGHTDETFRGRAADIAANVARLMAGSRSRTWSARPLTRCLDCPHRIEPRAGWPGGEHRQAQSAA